MQPNIVRYIENFDWDDRLLIIIMEYVSEGDLGKHIADYGPFSEDVTKSISQQLLSALGYLHANNITHRDVKPDNILISALEPAVEVKLTDFGLSKIVDTEQTFLRTFCGTLLYCAPEVYTEYAEYDDSGNRTRGQKVRRMPGQRYSHAVDIWSLGGVIFYTLTGSPPYPVKSGISHSELLNRIMTTRLNVSPLQREGVSDVGVDFLSRMLQRRPENRATVAELDIHSWMGGPESSINASQSYDEITDDEDLDVHAQIPHYDDDYISESMGEESEKENGDSAGQRHHQQPPPNQRLFGEVGVSAIGSSGVIPDDFLNLPVQNDSMRETKIVGYPGDEAYDTADSGTPAGTRTHRRTERQGTISMAQQQSTDQLQSLVMNVASQSLGGSDDSVNEGASSRFVSMDFNASKRKPPSHDTSDEFDENVAPTKPSMKRLKSEGNIDELSETLIEECKLLACMPQVRRLGSGRQIDGPVNKVSYWEQDRTTWHLNYPEMTQLQHDAFAQAARDRGEQFAPGKTPLWDLAMRHFFPMQRLGDQNSRNEPTRPRATLRRDEGSTLDAMTEFPPTAVPVDQGIIPDSPLPDTQIVVPIQLDAATHRAVGIIESHPFSCIQGISFPITDTLVSFGRGPDNTEAFEPKTEPRVPKYAFKILVWRDGCDAAQEPAKASPPWVRETGYDESAYSFWISTKATLGIRINGHSLPSSDSKNPSGPSRHWTRIFDGDDLVIWGGVEPRNQTSLSFRCFWGASKRPRADKTMAPEMASEVEAEQLDLACQRAEKRIRDGAEKQRRVREAEADFSERSRTVEQERERSRAFEMKRLEAIEFLQAKRIVASRRISPASASAFT
jgi:serine/threonine protein kinase